jgi:ribosomal protein L11 methylase PrmA
MSFNRQSGSFRDPSGFIFHYDGEIYRQINSCYAKDFDYLISSGLYADLTNKGWLIDHEEQGIAELAKFSTDARDKIIKPTKIPYVSYPYEWAFSQLKDAALLTLAIQISALKHGMTLKDASAYNVQFVGSQPVFIDTLSFERYVEDSPWAAYRQFCQHFLGPLALMSNSDIRLRHLLRSYVDGLPLDLVSHTLPRKTFLRYGLLSHIHLHAASQKRHQDDSRKPNVERKQAKLSKRMQFALLESLRSTITKCRPPAITTEWGDYYGGTNYSENSMASKEQLVVDFVSKYANEGHVIHDLGGNTGEFSRLVAAPGRYVVSHDIDDLAVERNYLTNRSDGNANVLALVLDLTNPSPAQGWSHVERDSFMQRIAGHTVMALALVHHLAIGNNVPLPAVATFFQQVARKLVIEFIPKEDSQVRRLLASRVDIFPDYNQASFVEAFEPYFTILDQRDIEGTLRTLYVMERK